MRLVLETCLWLLLLQLDIGLQRTHSCHSLAGVTTPVLQAQGLTIALRSAAANTMDLFVQCTPERKCARHTDAMPASELLRHPSGDCDVDHTLFVLLLLTECGHVTRPCDPSIRPDHVT